MSEEKPRPQGRDPDTEPQLVFEPVEDPAPRPPPRPPKPPRPPAPPPPPPRSDEPATEEPPPEPPAFVEPRAVKAGPEPSSEVLHRDRRGRVVGDRFAVLCDGERELIHAVGTLSRVFSLADGVELWAAADWRLLVASGGGMAREMLSSQLDATIDSFRLGRIPNVRLYVGGRGVFVPYTGRPTAWDIEGDLPGIGPPRLLDPERDLPAADAWRSLPAADLLPRMAIRQRLREVVPEVGWVLASERIFPALLSWARDAGSEISFAVLRSEEEKANGQDAVLLCFTEGLQASQQKLLGGLPEVDLLWDPLTETEEGEGAHGADRVPSVLVAHGHELPVHLTAAPFLTDADRPVVFLAGRAPLVLAGPIPLTPGTALIRPELADPPQRMRLRDGKRTPAALRLPLRLVRRGAETAARRTRALLLTPDDLKHLAVLRDHLPWAVTSRAQMAQFADVAFLLLGEEATWNLPIGLPYWGDDAEGVYLTRGWQSSPEVPAHVVRRATGVGDGEVAFLSPARLWCVPQQAFQPLAGQIELRRDLSRVHLEVMAARFETEPVFPELVWPEEPEQEEEIALEELPRRPAPPATRSRLLKKARAALARGEHEKAAVLFERAGEFVQAAELYDQMIARGGAS